MPTSSTPEQLAQEALQQGIIHHRAGRLEAAETLYRAILDLLPGHGDAHFHLGLLALQLGQAQAGLKHLRAALENDARESRYWLGYIAGLALAGQTGAAREVLGLGRQTLPSATCADLERWLNGPAPGTPPGWLADTLLPGETRASCPTPEAGSEMLIDCFTRGDYGGGVALARQLTARYPNQGFFWKVLGACLWQQGRPGDALAPMLKAVELLPDDVEALGNLGAALEDQGHPREAEAIYRRALGIRPDHPQTLSNLGDNLRQGRRYAEARPLLEAALGLAPDFPEAHNNLGALLHTTGDLAGARQHLEQALQLRPDYPEALVNLANVLQEQQELARAEQCLRRALTLQPRQAIALNNLGNLMALLGQGDEAEALLRQALELRPDYHEAHSNLLFNLNYDDRGSPASRLAEARRYGEAVSRQARPYESWNADPNPARLRVGLVSGDLRQHPVGYFLAAILPHLAGAGIELHAYPTRAGTDALSGRLQSACATWHPIDTIDDAAAAARIHADRIHVLLDLAGHTAHNRLPLFAWKPAPVQASWLGYFATTGVAQMDYLLADPTGVPASHQADFSETIHYLPDTRLCFSEPDLPIPVNDLPCRQQGVLTFGCFQNLAKVGDRVLAAWAAILTALPSSRLRWQCKQFGDESLVAATLARLERLGIPRQKVSLHGPASRADYLRAHHEVDLILDTFPYPGGTTTCEALWMGVPTLTLAGASLHARQGASLLQAAGLPDWIADSEATYVQAAIRIGRNPDALALLRQGLRAQVLASPLFDAPGFARHLGAALWSMWQTRAGQLQYRQDCPPTP